MQAFRNWCAVHLTPLLPLYIAVVVTLEFIILVSK